MQNSTSAPARRSCSVSGILASLSAAAALVLPAAGAETRPNLLFLLADDMRADAMSCAGNPVLQTPALDALAARGTRFPRAFVTTAICCVSRASILTGQHARRHGVNDFQTPLRDLAATWPVQLRAAGWFTGFIGKWGIHAANGPWLDASAQAHDFWAGDAGQTSYWHERTCGYVTNNGTTERKGVTCTCSAASKKAEGAGTAPGTPHPSLADPVHTDMFVIPRKAHQFLDAVPAGQPWCLSISFKCPHAPWTGYAPQFAGDFADTVLPKKDSVTEADALAQPDFLRRSLGSGGGLQFTRREDVRQREQGRYYRLIRGLDASIGAVVGQLRERGLLENTVILFASDHGHFLGEHGLGGKWLMHEESITIPFIVVDPRQPSVSRTSDAMALNLDIGPTLLAAAGLPVPAAMQGRSLLPCLTGATPADWRDHFFYQHLYGHRPAPPDHIERSEGVRTLEWKYTQYIDQTGPEREQLFDLKADPLERRDLAADPARTARLTELRDLWTRERESVR